MTWVFDSFTFGMGWRTRGINFLFLRHLASTSLLCAVIFLWTWSGLYCILNKQLKVGCNSYSTGREIFDQQQGSNIPTTTNHATIRIRSGGIICCWQSHPRKVSHSLHGSRKVSGGPDLLLLICDEKQPRNSLLDIDPRSHGVTGSPISRSLQCGHDLFWYFVHFEKSYRPKPGNNPKSSWFYNLFRSLLLSSCHWVSEY